MSVIFCKNHFVTLRNGLAATHSFQLQAPHLLGIASAFDDISMTTRRALRDKGEAPLAEFNLD